MEFVQVRLRTNIAPSNAFGQVQMQQEIVLGRLTEFGLPNSVIRRLFFVGAVIREGMRGTGEFVVFYAYGCMVCAFVFRG